MQHTKRIRLGDKYVVDRLGFGAMRITGEGIFGPPEDPEAAKSLLKQVVEAGVDFIDTADSYGPHVSEQLLGEALAPYEEGTVIGTKAGLVRPGPGDWKPLGRPEHIQAACDRSLRDLRLERIPLYQLHRIDPEVPVADSIGAMLELREAGKIDLIGLSEVDVDELQTVREMTPVASVQNLYNIGERKWDPVVDLCEAEGIAFIPWYPVAAGDLDAVGESLDEVARAHDASRYAVALAWLLHRSPAMLPIPGTSNPVHFAENMRARTLVDEITEAEWQVLDGLRN